MQDYKPEQNRPSEGYNYPYPPNPAYQADPNQQQNLYREARRRVKQRMAFYSSLVSYIVVNAFLVFIWAMTSGPGSYFWPGWVIAGWGIGLAFQAAAYFFGRKINQEQMIQDELRRMGHH
jgi:hypothetical protein